MNQFFLPDDTELLNVACYQIHQTYFYQNRLFPLCLICLFSLVLIEYLIRY